MDKKDFSCECIVRTAKEFGKGSAHVIVPVKWIGKKLIIVKKD